MLDTGGAGIGALRNGFAAAFPSAYQTREFPVLELGGATDGGLLHFLLDTYQIPWAAEHEESFYLKYLEQLKPALEESYRKKLGRKLPGVVELIDTLAESPHHLGLLTGNIGRAAHLKLRSFQFRSDVFAAGAFGDDHHDRNQLGPIAIDRAQKVYGRSFHPDEVFILGDTLKDIACARACGARVIAVATGAHDYETLKDAEPDFLFRDFNDYQSVLKTTGLVA